ncbi:hypothetical protein AAKU55_000171 [Oxalobacteraceae bacterium GrIS 1.11]
MRIQAILIPSTCAAAALINYAAQRSTGWEAMGYLAMFGIFPLIALLLAFAASLLLTAVPRLHKLVMGIGIAYAVLLSLILMNTLPIHLREFLLPSCLWLLPLMTWYGLSKWFAFRRKMASRPA